MKSIVLLYLTIPFVFCSCFSQKPIPDNYSGKKFEFGSGGGFAGMETSYFLLDNGMIFEKNLSDTSFTFIKRLDKEITSQIFLNYNILNINTIDINNPGNIYKFMVYYDKVSKHRMVWNGNSAPDRLTLFYNNLYALCIKLN